MQAEKDWLFQLQKQNVLAIASLAVESLSLRVSIHCRGGGGREGGRGQGSKEGKEERGEREEGTERGQGRGKEGVGGENLGREEGREHV